MFKSNIENTVNFKMYTLHTTHHIIGDLECISCKEHRLNAKKKKNFSIRLFKNKLFNEGLSC